MIHRKEGGRAYCRVATIQKRASGKCSPPWPESGAGQSTREHALEPVPDAGLRRWRGRRRRRSGSLRLRRFATQYGGHLLVGGVINPKTLGYRAIAVEPECHRVGPANLEFQGGGRLAKGPVRHLNRCTRRRAGHLNQYLGRGGQGGWSAALFVR